MNNMTFGEDIELQHIFDDAYDKYREGAKEHGELNIDTDTRDFLKEAEYELLDSIVYLAFQIVRLRRMRHD